MTDQLNISSVIVNGRGNKTAAILDGKERYYVQFDTTAQCLWPPSNFDKNEEATRMGINFEPTDELVDFFHTIRRLGEAVHSPAQRATLRQGHDAGAGRNGISLMPER